MTDKDHLLQMLIGAKASFTERSTKRNKNTYRVAEVDNGGGALAIFEFNKEGILVTFDIDKDAY